MPAPPVCRVRLVAMHALFVAIRWAPDVEVGPLLDLVQSEEAMAGASDGVVRALARASIESVRVAPAPARGARFDGRRLTFAWAV